MNKVKDSFLLGFESVAKVGTCITSCILSKFDDKVNLTIANMGDCEIALFSYNPLIELHENLFNSNNLRSEKAKEYQYSNHFDHVGFEKNNSNNPLTGTKLTEVHNAHNPKEQELLYKLHPDEIDMFQLKNSAI